MKLLWCKPHIHYSMDFVISLKTIKKGVTNFTFLLADTAKCFKS